MPGGELKYGFVLKGSPSGEPNADSTREWTVQPRRHRILSGELVEHLEPRAMRLLVYFAEMQGEVVSKEEIVQAVWDGAAISDEALTRVICDLRRALRDDAREPAFIETIPRSGYRLRARLVRDQAPRVAYARVGGVAVIALLAALLWFTRPYPHPEPSMALVTFENRLSGSTRSFVRLLEGRLNNEGFEPLLVTGLRRAPKPRPGDYAVHVSLPPEGAEGFLLARFMRPFTEEQDILNRIPMDAVPDARQTAVDELVRQIDSFGNVLMDPLTRNIHVQPWFDLTRHDFEAVYVFLRGASFTLNFHTGGGGSFANAMKLDEGFLAPAIWGIGSLDKEAIPERVQLLEERFADSLSEFDSEVAHGTIHLLRGEWAYAVRRFQRALDTSEGRDNGPLTINYALAKWFQGSREEAFGMIEGLIEDEDDWPYSALYAQAADWAIQLDLLAKARAFLARTDTLDVVSIDVLALREAFAILDGDGSQAQVFGSALDSIIQDSPPEERVLLAGAGYGILIELVVGAQGEAAAAPLLDRLDQLSGKTD